MEQRTTIVKKWRDRINAYYGPSGSEALMFRKVVRGPMNVALKTRPCMFVFDNGQRRNAYNDNESEGRTLAIRTIAYLQETWDRTSNYEEWQDNIEILTRKMLTGDPADVGCTAVRYLNDEPLELVLLDGAAPAVWVVDFEVDYFTEITRTGDWA